MSLSKIKREDLLFSDEMNGTETFLNLYDYDWVNYTLCTKFITSEMGALNVKFEHCGLIMSRMEVEQHLNKSINTFLYEYPSEIFQKHIVKFLEKHIRSWNEIYTFDGEDEVISFFNDVLENATKVLKNK